MASLDAPVTEQLALSAVLPDDSAASPEADVVERNMMQAIRWALPRLNERQRLILRLRYGLGNHREHTFAEIGDAIGVSPQRVRQLEQQALAQLRRRSRMRQPQAA